MNQVNISANSVSRLRLSCASNNIAIAGGFHFLGHDDDNFPLGVFAGRARLVSSGPGDTPRRYVTIVANDSNSTAAGFIWATCARD